NDTGANHAVTDCSHPRMRCRVRWWTGNDFNLLIVEGKGAVAKYGPVSVGPVCPPQGMRCNIATVFRTARLRWTTSERLKFAACAAVSNAMIWPCIVACVQVTNAMSGCHSWHPFPGIEAVAQIECKDRATRLP